MPAEHVLYLPGLMCDERLWAPQLSSLQMPGTVADQSQHDDFASMAAAILADAPPTFAVAGLSMGGIVAFELWRQAPQRITHLALLDTNPHPDTADKRTLRLQQIEDVVSGRLEEVAINALKPALLGSKYRDDQDMLDLILKMVMDLGPDVFERQSLALKDRRDSMPTLSTIDCPTAVICGDEDSVCPLEYHELMAEQIPGAELSVISECGHLSTLEQPERVNAILRDLFLR